MKETPKVYLAIEMDPASSPVFLCASLKRQIVHDQVISYLADLYGPEWRSQWFPAHESLFMRETQPPFVEWWYKDKSKDTWGNLYISIMEVELS